MGFSQTTITSVNPPIYSGFQSTYLGHAAAPAQATESAVTAWAATGSAGDGLVPGLSEGAARLVGPDDLARIAMPTVGPVRIDIGTVLPGEEQTDFSADLPSAPARRAELSWLGGTFEDPDIAGFRVFGLMTAPVSAATGTGPDRTAGLISRPC